MREIKEIFIHCTATKPDFMHGHSFAAKVAEIKRWHVQDNGWKDIGYHFLIGRNGETAEGRPVETEGAHARGHNTGSIGVSMFGGHGSSEKDLIQDHFTPAQIKALKGLIRRLRLEYPGAVIRGHNEVAAKACPGFSVQALVADGFFDEKIEPVAPPRPVEEIKTKPVMSALARLFLALAEFFQGKSS